MVAPRACIRNALNHARDILTRLCPVGPANAKHELLTSFIRQQYVAYKQRPIREFQVKYNLLGMWVCRGAFCKAAGVGASFITSCRTDAINNRQSYHAMYDNCFEGEGGPRSNQRRAAYLDARAWIREYARTHASQSPISGRFELPAGRKQFYHSCYCYDRQHQQTPPIQPADITTFRKAWRFDCPHVAITTSTSKFTQCGLCAFLKGQMDQCPRSNQSLLQALRARLGAHFKFQSAQRVRIDDIAERCRQSGGKAWFFTIDKMDQTATICPTIWSQLSSPLFKLGTRLVCGVVGSEWAGPQSTQMLLRSVFQDVSGGSETQCSIVLTNLLHVARREGHLPHEVVMNPDNTAKESKNQIMLWFQIWLLCVLRDTCFYSFSTVFLIVGHTHNSLDRFFSRLAVSLKGNNYDTLDEMWSIITKALSAFHIQILHTKQTWAFKELGNKSNATHPNGFRPMPPREEGEGNDEGQQGVVVFQARPIWPWGVSAGDLSRVVSGLFQAMSETSSGCFRRRGTLPIVVQDPRGSRRRRRPPRPHGRWWSICVSGSIETALPEPSP